MFAAASAHGLCVTTPQLLILIYLSIPDKASEGDITLERCSNLIKHFERG